MTSRFPPSGLLGAIVLAVFLGAVQVAEGQDSPQSDGTATLRLGLYDSDVVKTMPEGWTRADGDNPTEGSATRRGAGKRGERVLRLRDDPRVGPYEIVPDDGEGEPDVEP